MSDPIVVAWSGQTDLTFLPGLANRHGCITGATGTGKTVTLQGLTQAFSLIGTPVANIEQPVEILRTVHSFDPCLACAVHLYDPQGRHLHQLSFE